MTTQILGWAIIHSLWEGGVIAAIAAGIFALAQSRASSLRYWVGLIALSLMIVAPIVTAMRWEPTRNVTAVASALPRVSPSSGNQLIASGGVSSPGSQLDQSFLRIPATSIESVNPSASGRIFLLAKIRSAIDAALPWLVVAWLIGLTLAAGRLVGGLKRTKLLKTESNLPADRRTRDIVDHLSRKLGIKRFVTVLESARIEIPVVVGALKPAIIVPASLLSGLAPWQLEMLIAHELAHIQRYDFLVNLVQTVAETLLFYHPAARWLSERIRDERENCCDDTAIAICGSDPHVYTETLLALEESRSGDLGLAAAASGGSLLRRARRLLGRERAHVELGPRWIAGVITIAAVLLTGRDAMGSAIQESFVPASARVSKVADGDSTGRRRVIDPDPARARPDTTLMSPGGNFGARWDWANRRASALKSYWIGYLVAGDPTGQWRFYADPITPVHAGSSTMTGSMEMKSRDENSLRFSGTELTPLVGTHSTNSTAIFLHFSRSSGSAQLDRVHVATFAFPVHFDRAPLLWLDSVSDRESIDRLRDLASRAASYDVRSDLVSAVGVHQDPNVVVPALIGWIDSNQPVDVRREAVSRLGRHDDVRAISAMSRAARGDKEQDVRRAAIETFGEVKSGAAMDSLMRFARTLNNADDRRTALEEIADRNDPKTLSFLTSFALDKGDTDLRSYAIEALGEVHEGGGVPALLEIIHNEPSADLRRRAVQALGDSKAGPKSADVLADIARTDRDESVRREAAQTLADNRDPHAVELLQKLATNGASTETQMAAIEALSETKDPAGSFNVLYGIARSSSPVDVRRKAIQAMSELRSAPEVVPALVALVRADGPEDIWHSAIQALADTRRPEAQAALETFARNGGSYDLRRKAIDAITDQSNETEALNFLKSLLADRDSDIRVFALEKLGDLHGRAGMSVVQEIARSSSDPALKRRAESILNDR